MQTRKKSVRYLVKKINKLQSHPFYNELKLAKTIINSGYDFEVIYSPEKKHKEYIEDTTQERWENEYYYGSGDANSNLGGVIGRTRIPGPEKKVWVIDSPERIEIRKISSPKSVSEEEKQKEIEEEQQTKRSELENTLKKHEQDLQAFTAKLQKAQDELIKERAALKEINTALAQKEEEKADIEATINELKESIELELAHARKFAANVLQAHLRERRVLLNSTLDSIYELQSRDKEISLKITQIKSDIIQVERDLNNINLKISAIREELRREAQKTSSPLTGNNNTDTIYANIYDPWA
jgi:septal ring factor EnvC (AmiA/AmiB activator)